ncbi:CsgG/HfaB family protein [Planctomicrobium sp. SH661]|uniref:CsgG/HfaB family protein n=1 Tax=Planctomicrobium sp. SH661 TaxID=3448124 RepID=UPI003F5CA39F
MRGVWFLCLYTMISCGCIRTAVVKFWEPAAIDVCSMNRIVVLEFAGDQGKSVATSLSGQLWQNEFYTVVDQNELSQELQLASFSRASGDEINLHEILGPARAQGIDGVLMGEVIDYHCEDKHVRRTALAASSGGGTIGQNRLASGGGVGVEFRENLVREGTVTVAFKLVDAETGEIRAAHQVSHHYTGESELGPGKLPTRSEVLDTLTQKCLADIVGMLAPHEATSQIQLASCDVWTKGRREVKEGNRHAEIGQWDLAEQQWNTALEIEPNNHAAMFNLSIAADHRHDYALAEQLAMQALRLQHKTCYTAGLDEIRKHRSAAEKAEEQRDARVATAVDEIWR